MNGFSNTGISKYASKLIIGGGEEEENGSSVKKEFKPELLFAKFGTNTQI